MNSKKQRKFRTWDSVFLTQMCEISLQIKDKIEQQLGPNMGPEHLPMSVVPTAMLYDLAVAYDSMYEALELENLIESGYPKQLYKTH